MTVSVFDSGLAIGFLVGVLSIFAVLMFLLAMEIDKKLRKYRYRYGYDNEIEHPSRDKDYHPNERFMDWVNRVGFKKYDGRKIKFELIRHKARYILFGVLAMYYITANIVMRVIGMTDNQINIVVWFITIPASGLFFVALYNLEKRYKLQGGNNTMSDYQFKCDKCSYATDNEESLSQHQSMHNNNRQGGFVGRFKALGARF